VFNVFALLVFVYFVIGIFVLVKIATSRRFRPWVKNTILIGYLAAFYIFTKLSYDFIDYQINLHIGPK
jgi:hypothetical protein